MKTLNQIMETTNPYPSQIDQELQATINDWFGTREVCDDENFCLYFKRVLNRDYGRYCQILRLQPDISDYDWLVDKYTELKTEGTVTHSGASQGHSTLTHGLKTDRTGGTSHTGTVTHHHTQDETNNYDKNHEESSGSSSGKNVQTDNTATATKGQTLTTKKQGYTDNAITLDKANPQSISYTSTQTGAGGMADGVPNLNWQYASSQNQQVTKHTVDGTDPDVEARDETVQNTGTTQNDTSGSNSENRDSKNSFNRDETTTDTYNEQTSQNETVTNSGDDVTENNTSDNSSEDSAHYEIESGRTGSRTIADILGQAVSFIEGSNAWEWLSPRLEVCFMGVWDV